MSIRGRWLSSTMFYGAVGVAFVLATPASGADLFGKAPIGGTPVPLGAVDGINGKFEALGGTFFNESIAGVKGSLSLPLQTQYGLQIDTTLAGFDSRFYGAVGGHLFWRDPSRALFGLYASYSGWNSPVGTVNVGKVAAEGEYYFDRWRLHGIVGVEFGNTVSGQVVPGFIDTYDIKTRFYDRINVSYYLQDNLRLFVGHRYIGGKNALALGGEWGIPLQRNAMAALFVEGRAGEGDYHGIWGGVRFYVGQRDKSLIRRHREDDPENVTEDGYATIRNQASTTAVTPQTPQCPQGYIYVPGFGCEVNPD